MINSSSSHSITSGTNVQTKIPFQAPVVNRSLSPQSTKFSYLSELSNDEKSRLQAFKARRLEQKQADKEKLAREFPLLFSNTFGSPYLRRKDKTEENFPYSSSDSENIHSNLAHLNTTDSYYHKIEIKPLQSQSADQFSSINAPAMTKGKKKHRRRGSNEKLNIVVAAVTAASIERAEATGEVEATGPVVEDKDVSKKTLRNRKKRSMKKQRLLKKQQQAKAGGPELTEAEMLLMESGGCDGEDDGAEDDLEDTNDMNDSASAQISGAEGHVTPEDVDLTAVDGTDSPAVAVAVKDEHEPREVSPPSLAPSPESESSDLTSVEVVATSEQSQLESSESVSQVGAEMQLDMQVIVEDEVVLRELERERVQDVLDYMLFETKELDVPTHKRLSADCFAFHEIYALHSPTSAATTSSTSSFSALATSSSSAQTTTANPNGMLGQQPGDDLESTSKLSAGSPVAELDVLAALRAYLQKSNQLNGIVEGEDPNLSPLLQQANLPQRRRRTRRKNLTLTEADLTQVASLSMDECHPNPKNSDKNSRRTCLELVPEEKAEVDLPQIYPMSQLLDQARVTGWLKSHDEVKYIVQMQIEQDGCETRMTLLKTYADFKLFHQRLTDALGPSSMDAMCANLTGRPQAAAAGGEHIIPPLPSKEVLRIAEGRVIEEGGQQFLRARERYLDRWLKTIMLTQHNRNILQLKKLRQQIKIFIML
eukprot:gene26333-34964_t